MSKSEIGELLHVARNPSRTFDERFDAAMSAYEAAQPDGDQHDVLSTLLGLRAAARKASPAKFTRLEIAMASIEDEVGLGDTARARLEECKEVAALADAPQRCRLGFFLVVSHVRDGDIADAQAALEYFEENMSPACSDETQMRYEFLCGLVNETRSRWSEAERGYRRCVQMSLPEDSALSISARSGLARICMTRGNFLEAVLLVEGIELANHDGYTQTYNLGLMAYAYLGKTRPDQARKAAASCIEQAVSLNLHRVTANAHITVALCDWYEGDITGARASLRRSISLDLSPSNREYCLVLDAWFADEPLPQVTCPRAISLGEFLGPERPSTIDEPMHAVLAVLIDARRDVFVMAADGSTLTGRGEVHDLRQRNPMRRILARLVDARAQSEGAIPTGELFEAGWPGTENVGSNGFRRVYTELHRLRALGLVIDSIDGGYRLATEIVVERRNGESDM